VQARLEDIFGDNGMISTVVCRRDGQRCDVDSWIMSCRVLGRRVEEAILEHLVAQVRMLGVTEIIGRYIPTARNDLVRDHYNRLGFAQIAAENGETVWRLAVDSYCGKDLPMTVHVRRVAEPA
jgi:FkbH-like protein